jgi:uncharacterized membrane protein YfcA
MIVKNVLSALIGLWFIATPWMFGFVDQRQAFVVCICLGIIQFISSLLAFGKSGKTSWPNWISLCIGICFLVYPNVYHFEITEYSLTVFLGFVTFLFNYSNLFPDQ